MRHRVPQSFSSPIAETGVMMSESPATVDVGKVRHSHHAKISFAGWSNEENDYYILPRNDYATVADIQ